MNQNLLSVFSVVVNDKTFQFIPANSDFDEVQQALDQLKADFLVLKEERLKAEAETKAKADEAPPAESPAAESPAVESPVLEAEVVNA